MLACMSSKLDSAQYARMFEQRGAPIRYSSNLPTSKARATKQDLRMSNRSHKIKQSFKRPTENKGLHLVYTSETNKRGRYVR